MKKRKVKSKIINDDDDSNDSGSDSDNLAPSKKKCTARTVAVAGAGPKVRLKLGDFDLTNNDLSCTINEILKFKKYPEYSCVYLLRVARPKKNLTYFGSTPDHLRRWLQHAGIKSGGLSGGAKTTKGISCSYQYPLVPVCIIGSKHMTAKQRHQFEWRVKHVKLSEGSPLLNNLRNANGDKIHVRIRKLLVVACLDQWTSKAVKASTVPLTITWFDQTMKPSGKESEAILREVLPSYIKQRSVPNFQFSNVPLIKLLWRKSKEEIMEEIEKQSSI